MGLIRLKTNISITKTERVILRERDVDRGPLLHIWSTNDNVIYPLYLEDDSLEFAISKLGIIAISLKWPPLSYN